MPFRSLFHRASPRSAESGVPAHWKRFRLLVPALVGAAFVVVAGAKAAGWGPSRTLFPFIGIGHTEASVSFQHFVAYQASSELDVGDLNLGLRKAQQQVKHLFGPLQFAKPGSVGAPKRDGEVEVLRIHDKRAQGGWLVADYVYRGTLVLKDRVGGDGTVTLVLPRAPDLIYSASLTRNGREVPCTDPHYTSEGDFWYFWSPDRTGCRLREGVDYDRVTARVSRYPNTVSTYPEYWRLPDESGKIRVAVFFGMNSPRYSRNPYAGTDDAGAPEYRKLVQSLEATGFRRTALEWAPGRIGVVEVREKVEGPRSMRVWLYYGPSGLREAGSVTFRKYFRQALEGVSVVVYNGHSGLGGNLDLSHLDEVAQGRVRLPQDRYQILFFNGCSSYSYYNGGYFRRKASQTDPAGTRSLDVITNGLESFFNLGYKFTAGLLGAVHAAHFREQARSYEEILKGLESGSMIGVSGDEDNPTNDRLALVGPPPAPTPEPVPSEVPAPAPEPVPSEVPAPAPEPVPSEVPAPVPEPVPSEVPAPVPSEVPVVAPSEAPLPEPSQGPA